MYHFIYKTVHTNGKYYVGRHSTDNLDDGYIGSGRWPRSLKNRNNVNREILEWADDVEQLIELERRYLSEHYGKPGCMNMTPDPIGWNSEHNPMKRAEIVEKFRGDNHWTRKNPEKVVRGENHWLSHDSEAREKFLENHPNKDGRNAKLAMERGTHINLTNNTSTVRAKEGTHWWQNGKSPNHNGKLNSERVADGSHNWLGPEANRKRVESGTHNFLGSASNQKMLELGIHPSQIKIQCVHCNKISSKSMHVRWHGDKCKMRGKE